MSRLRFPHRGPVPVVVALALIVGACGTEDRGDGVRAVSLDDQTEVGIGPDQPEGDGTDDPVAGTIRADGSGDAESSATEDRGEGGGPAVAGETGGVVDGDDESTAGTGTGNTAPDETADGPDPGDADADDGDPASDGGTAGRAGRGLPDTPVIDLRSGTTVDLAAPLAAAGRSVLLWFWEPGSAASRAEAAVVQQLADESDDAVEVAAIGIGGDAASAARFPRETGLRGITIVWDDTARTAEQYAVTSLPTAILVDTGGDVIGRWTTLSPEVLQLIRLLG